ncbi:hypothetical protein HYDPIDRAFT_169975 [Hydnomerulius pinastri MD-312]|uniref:Uncharacterized protein n=1 Tax=Hydnomerulius pinastri MD-312 TaxID=994086 RepID=A0A0C9V5T7_9AGAM|nr:hypothetical protein HYDPIDRAFT_169975 [Hydnomerulius pinastri MD-312]
MYEPEVCALLEQGKVTHADLEQVSYHRLDEEKTGAPVIYYKGQRANINLADMPEEDESTLNMTNVVLNSEQDPHLNKAPLPTQHTFSAPWMPVYSGSNWEADDRSKKKHKCKQQELNGPPHNNTSDSSKDDDTLHPPTPKGPVTKNSTSRGVSSSKAPLDGQATNPQGTQGRGCPSNKAILKMQAPGKKTVDDADTIVKEYGLTWRTVMVAAGLESNWYAFKHSKEAEESLKAFSSCQRAHFLQHVSKDNHPTRWEEIQQQYCSNLNTDEKQADVKHLINYLTTTLTYGSFNVTLVKQVDPQAMIAMPAVDGFAPAYNPIYDCEDNEDFQTCNHRVFPTIMAKMYDETRTPHNGVNFGWKKVFDMLYVYRHQVEFLLPDKDFCFIPWSDNCAPSFQLHRKPSAVPRL